MDNVLQRIADPVFLGATIDSGKMSGAKVVRKACPEEKVGVMCKEDGKPHIIEYYEMTDDMLNKRLPDGSLAYGFGAILNYLFPIQKLKETLDKSMPLHIVKKRFLTWTNPVIRLPRQSQMHLNLRHWLSI